MTTRVQVQRPKRDKRVRDEAAPVKRVDRSREAAETERVMRRIEKVLKEETT